MEIVESMEDFPPSLHEVTPSPFLLSESPCSKQPTPRSYLRVGFWRNPKAHMLLSFIQM